MKPPPLLRAYQEQAVQEICKHIDKRPLLVLPTGGGKSPIFAAVAQRLDLPAVGFAHRKELLTQMRGHFDAVGLYDAQAVSIQKRSHTDSILAICDEAHHGAAKSYQKLNDYPYLFGVTATPLRADGRGLGNMFGKLIIGATPRQLVAEGYLYAPQIYTQGNPDMKGVSKRGGDYVASEAHTRMLQADVLGTYKSKNITGPTLGYATCIKHSQELAAEFNYGGVPAAHVDGNTGDSDRAGIFEALRTGRIKVVWNVNIATEGFDIPHLDCAIFARPTDSLCMYLQMCGRVMRPQGSSIILDHAGNALRHGSPLQDIKYTLDDTVRRKGMPLGLKLCKNCYLMVDVKLDTCPECGEDLSPAAIARIRLRQGELVEFQDREDIFYRSVDDYRELFGEPLIINGRLMLAKKENKDIIYDHFKRLYGIENGAKEYRKLYKKWPRKFCAWYKINRGRYPV